VFSVKQEWDAWAGQQVFLESVSPSYDDSTITCTVTTVKSRFAGEIGGVLTEIMLDSGSTISLIHHTTLSQMKVTFTKQETPCLHLVTASGDPLPITAHLLLPVVIGQTSVA